VNRGFLATAVTKISDVVHNPGYMAHKMFSVGNVGAGFLFGLGFCFGWFKTCQMCNDVLIDRSARTVLSVLLIIVTVFVLLGMVYLAKGGH
jgi:hypothetical protein